MLADSPRVYPGRRRSWSRRLSGRVRLAVVSTTWRENVDVVLAAAGPGRRLRARSSARRTSTAVKPDPEGYRAGPRSGCGLPAEAAVALEDSASGLQAARGAGLRALAVGHRKPRGEWVGTSDFVADLTEASNLIGLLASPERAGPTGVLRRRRGLRRRRPPRWASRSSGQETSLRAKASQRLRKTSAWRGGRCSPAAGGHVDDLIVRDLSTPRGERRLLRRRAIGSGTLIRPGDERRTSRIEEVPHAGGSSRQDHEAKGAGGRDRRYRRRNPCLRLGPGSSGRGAVGDDPHEKQPRFDPPLQGGDVIDPANGLNARGTWPSPGGKIAAVDPGSRLAHTRLSTSRACTSAPGFIHPHAHVLQGTPRWFPPIRST